MIFIDRTRVKVPNVLLDSTKIGKTETAENIKFAEKGEFDKMSFGAYSHETVRDALIDLFKGKCAYCESRFLHVYTGDIEHFRPKGRIVEALPQTPGYYWLAAEWTNLLLSCRHCNQTLRHQIFGAAKKSPVGMGKLDQFPMRNNFKHIQSHKHTSDEFEEEEKHRLLINPCIENPEEYFKYESHGVIKPTHSSGKKFEMAQKSIEVYVLQRMSLVQAREKTLIEISAQMQRVLEAVKNLDESMKTPELQNKRVIFDKILKRELIRLNKFKNDTEEYAGMARQMIDDFMDKHF